MCIYLDKYYPLMLILPSVRSICIDYDVVHVRYIHTLEILSCTSRPTLIVTEYFIVEIDDYIVRNSLI